MYIPKMWVWENIQHIENVVNIASIFVKKIADKFSVVTIRLIKYIYTLQIRSNTITIINIFLLQA